MTNVGKRLLATALGSGRARCTIEGQRILSRRRASIIGSSRGGRSYAFQARAFFCCEWGSASEVAKAKSPARFEVCSGQFELGVGAAFSDSSRISLLCSRGLSGLSAFCSLFRVYWQQPLRHSLSRGVIVANGSGSFLLLRLRGGSSFYLAPAPLFRPLRSSSSCDLAPALQQLQQHDGDIRRLRISSSSFYLRMRRSSAAWCDIVHDGDDVDDGGVALKCNHGDRQF